MAQATPKGGKPTDPTSLFSKALRGMKDRIKNAAAAAKAAPAEQGRLGTTLEPRKAPYVLILDEAKLWLSPEQTLKAIFSMLCEEGSAERWYDLSNDEDTLRLCKDIQMCGIDMDDLASDPEQMAVALATLTARKPELRVAVIESKSEKKRQDGSSYVNVYINRLLKDSTTGVESAPATARTEQAFYGETPNGNGHAAEAPDEAPEETPAAAPEAAKRGRRKTAPAAPPAPTAPEEVPVDDEAEVVEDEPEEVQEEEETVSLKQGNTVEFTHQGKLVRGVVDSLTMNAEQKWVVKTVTGNKFRVADDKLMLVVTK